MFVGLTLFVLGCLAVPNLIISKQPNAKQILDKIVPFQGWIGVVGAIIGIVHIPSLLSSLRFLGHGLSLIGFLLAAVAVVTLIVLGFILGIGIIKSFVKDATAQAKLDAALAKVTPYQVTLGIIGIVDGILVFLNALIHIV